MSPTATYTLAREDAIEAIHGLPRVARQILYQLAGEVAYFERRTDSTSAYDMPRAHAELQVALQMFELAVKAAGGHYHES